MQRPSDQPHSTRTAPQQLAAMATELASSTTWPNWTFSLTSEDGKPPPLPPGTLPEVDMKDFAPYLQSIGHKIEDFERNKAAAQSVADKMLLPEDLHAKQGQGLMQAMTEVPATFFQPSFDLDQPELWQTLCGDSSEPPERHAMEQLSLYLDTIESHLVQEIAARYDSFFDASAHVQQLRSTVHNLCQTVSAMRQQTLRLEQEAGVAVDTLTSLSLQRKNLKETLKLLQAMQAVVQAEAALQAALPQTSISADYAGAMNVVELMKALLRNKDLKALTCFQALPDLVAGSSSTIQDLMVTEFMDRTKPNMSNDFIERTVQQAHVRAKLVAAAGDDHGHNHGVPPRQPLSLDSTASPPGSLQDSLYPLVVGLQRMVKMPMALEVLQGTCCTQFKTLLTGITQRSLEVYEDTLDELQEQRNESQLFALLEALLGGIESFVTYCISVSQVVDSVLTEVAPNQPQSKSSSGSFLQAVSEVATSYWSKVLVQQATGGGTSGTVKLTEMKHVLDATDQLAGMLEKHCARSVLGLRTAVQQYCRSCLDAIHSQAITTLTSTLEAEQWVQVEASPTCQRFVDAMQQQATGGALDANRQDHSKENGTAKGTTLMVGNQNFHVVQALQRLLDILQSYVAFHDAVPSFSAEVAQRVIELVKVFNSRTCQLVLGAGAMQIAGLKSITAKHLALSCQSLGALVALHPSLQAVFLRDLAHSRKTVLLADFGRALADLNIHCEEICNKLVNIMHDRLNANVRQLPLVAASWSTNIQPETSSPAPSSFATTNVKQLKILSNVLIPLLLHAEVASIFGRISHLFSSMLTEAYQQLEPQGRLWEAQVMADLGYLLDVLQQLPVEPEVQKRALLQLHDLHAMYKAKQERREAQAQAAAQEPFEQQKTNINQEQHHHKAEDLGPEVELKEVAHQEVAPATETLLQQEQGEPQIEGSTQVEAQDPLQVDGAQMPTQQDFDEAPAAPDVHSKEEEEDVAESEIPL